MPHEVMIDVEGDMLVASLPGTSYRAIYLRSSDQSKIIQARGLAVDKEFPMAHKEFEALAWEAATAKARQLGWIV